MMFPNSTCTTWLRKRAAELTAKGFKVESKENAEPVKSYLLKLASSAIDAELVVWETGATSMVVFNHSRNGYDLDRHDLILASERFESELSTFFGLIR